MVEVLCRFMAGHPYDFNARTHVYVPINKWDASIENISVSTRYVTPETQSLLSLRDKVSDLRRFIMDEYMRDPSIAISRDWLVGAITRFHHPESDSNAPVLIYKLIPDYIASSDLSDGTIRQYNVIKRMLERYCTKHPIYTDAFSADDLDCLYEYFSKERVVKDVDGKKKVVVVQRGRNTISSKFKKLRAVCAWAKKRGLMSFNPFDEYDIPSEVYGTPICLTTEELSRLERFEGLSPSLSVQRDIFLFQCHVGCRVSDLMKLTHSNIVMYNEVRCLQYIQSKLKTSRPITVRVPLDETASRLVDQYANADAEKLFPFISSVNYNEDIKDILEKAGIDRVVITQDPVSLDSVSRPIYEVASSHLARKTFASIMFNAVGSEMIVSSMTGHSSRSHSFKRYAFIEEETKLRALKSLENPASS